MGSARAGTTADPATATTAVPGVVRLVGALTALWCLGFAAANVVLEASGQIAEGPYAEYAAGLSVLNWFVFALKLAGAALAVAAVLPRPPWPGPALTGTALWAAAGTLAVYAAGSVVEGIGLATGVVAHDEGLRLLDVGYVLFFVAAAAGFVVLARSFSRRHGLRRRAALLGALLGPVVLATVLLLLPALLVALDVMPSL